MTMATLLDLRTDLRKTLGDPAPGKRFTDENLNLAIAWAMKEACRMRTLTTGFRSGTVPVGANEIVLTDPGLGMMQLRLEV